MSAYEGIDGHDRGDEADLPPCRVPPPMPQLQISRFLARPCSTKNVSLADTATWHDCDVCSSSNMFGNLPTRWRTSRRWSRQCRLSMAKGFDSEFEQWYRMEKAAKDYADTKMKGQVGDMIRRGTAEWIITGVEGMDGPVWRFAGKEINQQQAVSVHCLSLRQMGGNWQLKVEVQNVRVEGVPKLLQSFEQETESDKFYYMVYEVVSFAVCSKGIDISNSLPRMSPLETCSTRSCPLLSAASVRVGDEDFIGAPTNGGRDH
eukprot:764620-Hanusia_phi.AAC.1